MSLVLIVGFVSSSTASTLLGSPVVASVVVVVAVAVVSKASLPSLSQLTPVAIADRPPVWPPLAIISLTKDNAKDKNEDEHTEEDPHGDVSGLWQYNDPDTVCVMLSTRHPPLLR